MKKLFTLMVVAGAILAMATAGGADSGTITLQRIIVQAALSSFLMIFGTHFLRRGEAA